MFFLLVAQGQPVGIGMLRLIVNDPDLNLDARIPRRAGRVDQALIGGIPTQKAAKQTHIRALTGMGGRQRAGGRELNQDFVDVAAHQVARHATNPQGGGAVRTGWSTHHGSDHIVENAGVIHGTPFQNNFQSASMGG